MKALVVSRLLLGDMPDWRTFESQREAAGKILNRAVARNVSSQIGRNYRDLSGEIRKFMQQNFVGCEYHHLARLCDEVMPGTGLSIRLDEFERAFFCLADPVKQRFPFYSQVRISIFGLKFEFLEHHFLRDIETSLPELLDAHSRMEPFKRSDGISERNRELAAKLIACANFLSRSIISATFSLVEAFLSGLFFTAVHTGSFGLLNCDEGFRKFAETKESAPLQKRLDRVVRFASGEAECGTDEPFYSFVKVGKRYRDAIHHTTPFQRRDIEPGGRLTALYEIDSDIAFRCVVLSCETVLKICQWAFGASDTTDIASRCGNLLRDVTAASATRATA